MGQNYTQLAFTKSVKQAQEKYGSREIYKKMEEFGPDQSKLYLREIEFVKHRDSFYMATVGENGWPYVQFRGGPKGFLKVIDQDKLGYVDFKGNLQYISTGNINSSKKAALILLDYPTRRRLKIWAESEILNPKDHPDLLEKLSIGDYKATIERLVIFNVRAFDWNCPQHITPRYTVEEFKEDVLPQHPEIIEDCCPK